MLKSVRSFSLVAAVLCFFTAGARAQSSHPGLERTLSHVELGVSVPLEYTATTSGKVVQSQSVSSAAGYLINIRYTKSPWIGAEMNYKFSRFSQNYVYSVPGNPAYPPLGIDASVKEITWGYVVHTANTYAGFKPYAALGVGTTDFVPTPNGGQGLLRQFRATYYWNAGTDYNFSDSHFGARVQVRELIYLAPDFGQNYLTSGARTHTIEPSIGFYARF
jgi:hypothetical protein